MTNLAMNLAAAACNFPDAVAVRLDEHTLTYTELHTAAGAVAIELAAHGVAAGERV